MAIQQHVQIDGVQHRIAYFSPGRFTTQTGSPQGPIDSSLRPYSLIQIVNTDSTHTCYVGSDATVTKANGIPLGPGAAMKIASNDPSERVRFHDIFIAGDGSNSIVVAFWGV